MQFFKLLPFVFLSRGALVSAQHVANTTNSGISLSAINIFKISDTIGVIRFNLSDLGLENQTCKTRLTLRTENSTTFAVEPWPAAPFIECEKSTVGFNFTYVNDQTSDRLMEMNLMHIVSYNHGSGPVKQRRASIRLPPINTWKHTVLDQWRLGGSDQLTLETTNGVSHTTEANVVSTTVGDRVSAPQVVPRDESDGVPEPIPTAAAEDEGQTRYFHMKISDKPLIDKNGLTKGRKNPRSADKASRDDTKSYVGQKDDSEEGYPVIAMENNNLPNPKPIPFSKGSNQKYGKSHPRSAEKLPRNFPNSWNA